MDQKKYWLVARNNSTHHKRPRATTDTKQILPIKFTEFVKTLLFNKLLRSCNTQWTSLVFSFHGQIQKTNRHRTYLRWPVFALLRLAVHFVLEMNLWQPVDALITSLVHRNQCTQRLLTAKENPLLCSKLQVLSDGSWNGSYTEGIGGEQTRTNVNKLKLSSRKWLTKRRRTWLFSRRNRRGWAAWGCLPWWRCPGLSTGTATGCSCDKPRGTRGW